MKISFEHVHIHSGCAISLSDYILITADRKSSLNIKEFYLLVFHKVPTGYKANIDIEALMAITSIIV